MLQRRSILLEVCLFVVVVSHVKCQNYDYAVDEGEDHGDLTDEAEPSEHPDYSKYYSVDNSAPLISPNVENSESSGFVSPIEFSSFFGPSPIAFGASNNQEVAKAATGFVSAPNKLTDPFDTLKQDFPEYYSNGPFPKDYFEESQQQQKQEQQQEQQQEENEEDVPANYQPGPSYISHKLPIKYNPDEKNYHASNVDEVETINLKPSKKPKSKYSKYETKNQKNYKSPDYNFDLPVNHNKYTNYNSGKSSSTISQYPTAAGLPEKYTRTQTSTLSPYQKYSFQPTPDTGFESKYLDTLISTVAPFNPAYNKVADEQPVFEGQSTENIPSNLKGCRKIKKPVTEAEAMNCYVCDDPESKSKYTQCSYTSEPDPVNHYSGTSERYSTPGKGSDGFRYKRYSNDDSYDDPYTYIKKRSEKHYNEPTESEQYKEDFQYSPDYYSDDEKSFSEQQSDELKKNPANCNKIEKDGMTCTICKNAKTGGNYEQCSYTSEPKEKKYAYVTEKKYDSEQPEESKPVVQTKELPTNKRPQQEFGKKLSKKNYEPEEEYESRARSNRKPEKESQPRRRNEEGRSSNLKVNRSSENNKPQEFSTKKSKQNKKFDDYHNFDDKYKQKDNKASAKSSKKLVSDDPYDIPQHFAESTSKERKHGGRGLDPALYGNPDSSETVATTEKANQFNIDEYHFKLFPEFENEESRQEQTHLQYPVDETSRQDVEEVLAEFTKKDRSHCKKAEKNGMTCYLCVDKNKIQHEECMYISESKPKSTHVAYHGVQHIKEPNNEADSTTKSTQQVSPTVAESKRKRFFKKVVTTPIPFSLEPSASDEIDTILEYKPKKTLPKRKRNNNKKQREPKTAASQYDTERIDEAGEPTIKTPAEFVVSDEEGAYSAETRPVYSKTLGVKLPKYMLEKSIFEKEFDEFSGAH